MNAWDWIRAWWGGRPSVAEQPSLEVVERQRVESRLQQIELRLKAVEVDVDMIQQSRKQPR